VLETAFLLELDFECADIEAVLQRTRRFEEIDIQRRSGLILRHVP